MNTETPADTQQHGLARFPLTKGSCEKSRKQLVWEGERPREPLRVRVFMTTGSPGRLPSLFFPSSRGQRPQAFGGCLKGSCVVARTTPTRFPRNRRPLFVKEDFLDDGPG